ERVTVTLDRALVDAANAAVAAGRADSLSAWVNLALAVHVAKERRLVALSKMVAEYEAGFGVITPDELALRERVTRGSLCITPSSTWKSQGSRVGKIATRALPTAA